MATDLERWAVGLVKSLNDEFPLSSVDDFSAMTALHKVLLIIEAARRVVSEKRAGEMTPMGALMLKACEECGEGISWDDSPHPRCESHGIDALAAALRDAGVPGVDK